MGYKVRNPSQTRHRSGSGVVANPTREVKKPSGSRGATNLRNFVLGKPAAPAAESADKPAPMAEAAAGKKSGKK